MKVLITGHTSGIGKAIYDYFDSLGYECIGCSRSNGYDISTIEAKDKILDLAKDIDIFVNNAYSNFDHSQLILLRRLYDLWNGQDKIIINISSMITVFNDLKHPILKKYAETKRLQDEFLQDKLENPYVINLKLGTTDTPRVSWDNQQKMTTDNVVEILDFIFNNRHKYKVNSITVG
jgi:nucleoside-diphosphate-sugar epimerase